MAQANGAANGNYIIAFSSFGNVHDANLEAPSVIRPGPALHQSGNIALSNVHHPDNLSQQPAYTGGYQTYHGNRGQQHQLVNPGYSTTQRSAPTISQSQYSNGYPTNTRPVLEQGYGTLPYPGAASSYQHQYGYNPASLIQPSGTYGNPTGTQEEPTDPVPLEPLKPGSIIHATASKTDTGVTLFRSTIPVLATSDNSDVDVKQELPTDMASVIEAESSVKVSDGGQVVQEKDSIVLEEDVDYENIEVTRVTTAQIHSEKNDISLVTSEESPEGSSQSQIESEIPEYATSSAFSFLDKETKGTSDVGAPSGISGQDVEATVSVVSTGAESTEPSEMNPPSTDKKVEEEEVYSVVNKATRTSTVITTRSNDEEDPYRAAPVVPPKTDQAYLAAEAEEVQSISSQGSALEEMRLKAQQRRQELDYYSTVEVNPEASENKLIVKGNKFVVGSEDDDYATVQIAGDTPVSSPTETSPPEREKLDRPTSQGYDEVKRQPIDFDLPKGYSFGGIFNVYLHQCLITHLRVDTIVNPSNEKLKHKEGISGDIAKAAGKDLDKICKKSIKKMGELTVGQVVMTAAGKLPSKRIIHAVAPLWDRYRDKKECVSVLEQTLNNIFRMCASEKVVSVAIPPISPGLFHTPNSTMADCFHRVLLNIPSIVASAGNNPPPSDIHLVDIRPDVLEAVIERLAGGNVTSEGQKFSIEQLSQDAVSAVLTAVYPPTAGPGNDARSNKNKSKRALQRLGSVDKNKGSISTFYGDSEQTQNNGSHDNTRL